MYGSFYLGSYRVKILPVWFIHWHLGRNIYLPAFRSGKDYFIYASRFLVLSIARLT